MNCQDIRIALSARMDDEDTGHSFPAVAEDNLDAHLAGCPSCREWELAAHEVTRRIRLTEAPRSVDRTEDLLAALLADAGRVRPRRRRAWSRSVLILVAAVQLALGIPAIVLGHLQHGPVHLAHELGSFDIALAAGFLAAAIRPTHARGMLAMTGVAAFTLLGTATIDLVAGRTDLIEEAPHLLAVAGWVALWVLARNPARVEPSSRTSVPVQTVGAVRDWHAGGPGARSR